MKKLFTFLILMICLSAFSQEKTTFPFSDITQINKKEVVGVRIKKDDFKGLIFVSPKGFMNENYKIEPYLSYKNNSVSFRIQFKYYSKSWLFHKKVMIKVDDEIMEFDVKPSENIYKGGISEISDISLNENEINFLRKVADSKKDIVIRFEGKDYSDQRLYSMERNYLKKIIEFFDKYKK